MLKKKLKGNCKKMIAKKFFTLPIISLIFFCALPTSAQIGPKAQMCSGCDTTLQAKEFAKQFANPMQCDDVFSESYSCTSQNKIVYVLSPNKEKVYKFNVYTSELPPWDVQATTLTVTYDESQAFATIAKFYKDLKQAVRSASLATSLTSDQITAFSTSTSGTDCPSGTALDALNSPEQLQNIRDRATIEIATNLMESHNYNNTAPHYGGESLGLSFRGVSYSTQLSASQRIPSYVKEFATSERPGSIADKLVFSIKILGFDSRNMPVIKYTLDDASRVAGYSLDILKGTYGPVVIDNQCIKQKLDQAVKQGILSKVVVPLSTEEPNPGDGDGRKGGGTFLPSCKEINFYQGGRLLYTFRECS